MGTISFFSVLTVIFTSLSISLVLLPYQFSENVNNNFSVIIDNQRELIEDNLSFSEESERNQN